MTRLAAPFLHLCQTVEREILEFFERTNYISSWQRGVLCTPNEGKMTNDSAAEEGGLGGDCASSTIRLSQLTLDWPRLHRWVAFAPDPDSCPLRSEGG